MLERNNVIYKRRKEHLNYYAMQNLLPEMKDYLPWLKEADSQALKYACRQLNTAFERFFHKQGGYPKFHSKRGKQSYKLKERGKHLVVIDKWYPSSQLCHCCGHGQPMPLKIRVYQCPKCSMICDRDLNAAINIKMEGLRLLSA